uniref:Uncharacterized protein n=1 Tax=Tanacetum cinerariifolium TaxID=118510 RepID=A0A6L2P3E4_TANCI|nr:hypothetical protein [Tanacetum cinerariifolium]
MAGSDSSSGISMRALDELVDLSGETEVPKFMSFVFSQRIAKEKAFVNMLHDQADHVRSCLDKLHVMIWEMQKAHILMGNDSLECIKESQQMENNKLKALTYLIAQIEDEPQYESEVDSEARIIRKAGDVVWCLDHMREIVARDFTKLKVLEQLLARTHVGICLKDSYVAGMEENK